MVLHQLTVHQAHLGEAKVCQFDVTHGGDQKTVNRHERNSLTTAHQQVTFPEALLRPHSFDTVACGLSSDYYKTQQ